MNGWDFCKTLFTSKGSIMSKMHFNENFVTWVITTSSVFVLHFHLFLPKIVLENYRLKWFPTTALGQRKWK